MARKELLAVSLLLFTRASAATLFSIPATAAILPNVPSVSSPYTVKFTTLVLDGGISGDASVLLSGPPQYISGQAAELFIILVTGWTLLALIPCAYVTAIAVPIRQTAIASSIVSVTVSVLVLACTLPAALVMLSQYGADAFAVAFPVPISLATALVDVGTDLRKKTKAA